ncbi:MAG: 3-phosphoshikimate 1-carboxyvinyltransferase [Selenomonadaceae bacterium]|nr:3-phosphoshikimate 1-carboxyvinyltransferase [Selenomonadaceae bacterium]MDY3915543.1 3-phosphoshikimate 1-carboxyvinyltransferase [Selenomonadaceae bacterium]
MSDRFIPQAVHGLHGSIDIPGDKSISHRSIMFSALADTPVEISNFLPGQDCLSTAACFQAMGVDVQFADESKTRLTVRGNGLHGLQEPPHILDAGNSGTTLRLMLGLMAAQPFLTTFTGDASLHQRPMGRVVQPLSRMGATIYGREGNTKLPLTVVPARGGLHGITYESPVASAQVKSALLLAGMYADGPTTVVEPAISRDHTERMLAAFGVETQREGKAVTINPVEKFTAPASIAVPGDISSAAYWLVAGSIIPGSELLLRNVGLNPTRTGIIDVLQVMGADLTLENERESGGEPAADIRVRATQLHGTTISHEMMPRLIDELPVIAVAALFAEGETQVLGAHELRVKESDRLQGLQDAFSLAVPGAMQVAGDDFTIGGGRQFAAGVSLPSRLDHRMAMSFAILGAAAHGLTIQDADCVDISYPAFYPTLERLLK